ncbi:MAG: glutamate racemase [Desulfobacterales bacterium]|nr:glutamate racemase [Desulfobacterales bacterium]
MMIGIFDSGVGGLTVVRAILDKIPGYDIVYFGDTAHTPYGTKSAETVIGYTINNIEFLLRQGAEMIVIACNTASSVVTAQVLEQFKVPIFEVITPAVAQALEASANQTFGIIGTRATIASGIYEKKIIKSRSTARIYSVACPLLVPLVEEGWLHKRETAMIVKKYLQPLKTRQIDTLILGCTHYPLLKDVIQRKIGKRVQLIDSSTCISERIKRFLAKNREIDQQLAQNGNLSLFVSDITDQFKKIAQMTLQTRITFECIRI